MRPAPVVMLLAFAVLLLVEAGALVRATGERNWLMAMAFFGAGIFALIIYWQATRRPAEDRP